jgi:hypothetical protein
MIFYLRQETMEKMENIHLFTSNNRKYLHDFINKLLIRPIFSAHRFHHNTKQPKTRTYCLEMEHMP